MTFFQTMKPVPVICFLALIFLLITISFAGGVFERPGLLKSIDVLPKALIKGPFHRVDDKVLNDGYMNTYTIHSNFGTFTTVSTASLKIRIEELKAVDAMKKVAETDTFQNAVKEAGTKTIEGVQNLVHNPEEALSGAVTGIGKLFQRAGEAIRSKPGAGEDTRFESLIGYSNTKREYAYEFGVDVYSPNPILQTQLDDMARMGYAGNLGITALKALIPGGVGLALSVTGGTQLMNDLIAKSPPPELRQINRKKLEAMGIEANLIDLYINKEVFTPRDQTLMTAALEDMKHTQNRFAFIKFAILTESKDVAAFRTRVAIMYAVYNRKFTPIDTFISFDPFVGGRTRNTLVFIAPVDYLQWTKNTEKIVRAIGEKTAGLKGIEKKELWFAGRATQKARDALKKYGWEVMENGDEVLDWRKEAKKNEPKS